jgi:diguanylate cyclase (GGDEF)-like protein/PAS domain S-box-containing protein
MRKTTKMTAIVIIAHSLASLSHILIMLPLNAGNDLFALGSENALLILSYMVIYLSLVFTLVLMVTKRTKEELEISENKFSTVFKTAPYALSITKLKDGTLLDFNDAFLDLSEYSSKELEGKTTVDLQIWDSELDRTMMINEFHNGNVIQNKELQFKTKSGKLLTCLFSSEFLSLNDGLCLLSSTTDISERIAMETELRQNRAFLSGIIEHSGNLICVKEIDGRYKLVNKKWEQITGLNRERVLGRTDLEVFPGLVGETFHSNDQIAMLNEGDTEHEESLETKTGKRYFLSIKFPLHDNFGKVSGLCAMISDITERKQTEEQIEHLANHDHLTDLPTIRLAKNRLALAMENAQLQHKQGALLYLDLDGFKQVNDTIGHDAGDLVLQEISRRLENLRKENDTVARIGGDEFLVILTEIDTHEIAEIMAKKILKEVNKPIFIGEKTFQISISIGIVLFTGQDSDLNSLVKKADTAMYESKRKGKNVWTMLD